MELSSTLLATTLASALTIATAYGLGPVFVEQAEEIKAVAVLNETQHFTIAQKLHQLDTGRKASVTELFEKNYLSKTADGAVEDISKGWIETPEGYMRPATKELCDKLAQLENRYKPITRPSTEFACLQKSDGTYYILIVLPEDRKG